MNSKNRFNRQSFRRLTTLALTAVSALLVSSSAFATVTFLGKAVLDGTGTDKSGLPSTVLEDGVSPQNGLNGIGSGLGWAGGDLFFAAGDRGPNKIAYSGGAAVDNTTSYPCRYQKFTIDVTPAGGGAYNVTANNVGTTLLKNGQGAQFVGISNNFTNRLDPETMRVAPDGTAWVSDEYGPFIYHFDRSGTLIGSLTLPAGFQIANPNAQGALETSGNTTGRVNNKGMEGLALTPDGHTLVGMMQDSLIQDGGASGIFVRVVVYDLTNLAAAPKQYAYQLDSTAMGVSDLLAVNSHQFLVDERDGTAGSAGVKDLYEFDLNQATAPTDLTTSIYPGTTASNGLPASAASLDASVIPLSKSLLANIGGLLTAAGSPAAFTNDSTHFKTDLPDKLEGYSWGPNLADGRHLLLVTNDNDFSQPAPITAKAYPNYIWAFAVSDSDLPIAGAVTLPTFNYNASAVQSIDHIIVVYQENWTFDGLYGSFPGANGIANADTLSKTQIDRASGNAVSTLGTFSNVAYAATTTINPPAPLVTDSASAAADARFFSGGTLSGSLIPNTLQPYSMASFVNPADPSALTGDIYHRYWQEQFQVAGTVFTFPGGVQTDADAGHNSGFVSWSDDPGLVMGNFDATNLPEGLLAQQYTICDNYFHSAFGGSFLNHQFLVAAAAPVYYSMPTSNNSNIAYLDSNGVFVMNASGSNAARFVRDGSITPVAGDVLSGLTINGVAQSPITITSANTEAHFGAPGTTFDKHYVVNTTRSVNLGGNGENGIPGNGSAALVSLLPSQNDSNPSDATRPYIPNIGDTLSAANVSWKWYSGGWDQIVAYSGSNPSPRTSPSYASMNGSNGLTGQQFQYHHQPLAYFDNYAPFGSAIVPAAYVGGFAGVGTAGLTAGQSITEAQNSAAHIQDESNFFTDVTNNTLPSVVFIKPVGQNNEHPGYGVLEMGQNHVASIVQAVQANPALWAHTAIIITYDEHGGRWDHVTPPTRDIWGPGERVPAIVISPFAQKGFVDHTQYDTSSILASIEQKFNLNALNSRDGTAPSLFGSFTTLDISRGTLTANNRTHVATQPVTITNRGAVAVTGPIQLILDNLVATTSLTNKTGIATGGSPYITATAGNLAPGASVTVTLQFPVPASGGITYSTRTVSGTTTP